MSRSCPSARALSCALSLALLAPFAAQAATFTVTTLDDEPYDGTETVGAPDGNGLSLREAIGLANDTPGDDIIEFDAGLANGAIAMLSMEMPITEGLAITGSGQTLDAQNATRVFRVSGAAIAVSMGNLTLTNGLGGVTGDALSDGGGILVEGGASLILTSVNISNSVGFSGGAIDVNTGSSLSVNGGTFSGNSAARAGGAIEHNGGAGTLISLTNVSATGNSTGATPGNGGFYHVTGAGDTAISGGDFSNNTAANEGGALWNDTGTMTLTGAVVIDGNTASGANPANGGGGIFQRPNGTTIIGAGAQITDNVADGASGSGGGIFNAGVLTVTGSTLSGNSAVRAGGGIESIDGSTTTLTGVTLTNNTTGANPGNGGGFHITLGGNATITDSTITGNTAANEGGGVWNGSGLMTIQGSTTISNNAANGGTAAHDGGGGVFQNANGTTNITAGVQILNNSAPNGLGSGGGILNLSTVNLTGVTISGNSAVRAGGGIESADGTTTTLTGVTLTNNTTGSNPGNGGGFHITLGGNATITDSTITGNTAALEGGGVWNGSGLMTIQGNTVISNNTANGGAAPDDGGGGVFQNAGGTTNITAGVQILNNSAPNGLGSGGGILNLSTVNLTGVTISGNSAVRAGGGIESAPGTTTTLNNVTLSNNSTGANPGNGGGFHITGNGNATISGGTVTGNTAASEGGGLWNGSGQMSVTGTTVSGNTASGNGADNGGGGLFNNGGTLAMNGVIVSNNVANGTSGSGGGVFNEIGGTLTVVGGSITGNSASRAGGGIEDNAGAGVTLTNVLVQGNSTGSNPGNGGGLHITGAGTVTVNTSSFIANTASNEGGGLWNSAAGSMTINTSTVSGNSSPAGGGVFKDGAGGTTALNSSTVAFNTGTGLTSEGGTFSLSNSAISNNTQAACAGPGSYASSGFNLLDTTTGCPITTLATDITGRSAQLLGLALNGGLTPNHLPGAASPLLDAGNCTGVDQRGQTRPFDLQAISNIGNGCDIGAVEALSGGVAAGPEFIPSHDWRGLLLLLGAMGLAGFLALRRRTIG